ncbi:hypothetical protein PR048_033355 [Dryococelus australis]|uniref:Uncharacterized protein n=1 Tax=Dryococelus australis TaxID=614101 RepID=A0ABQ9G0Z9_9NEOP|nr:hypothetical protein PR048_033355 [Dryococelus australis]
MKWRGKQEMPEKTRRPAASSGAIPPCENPESPGWGFNPDRLVRTLCRTVKHSLTLLLPAYSLLTVKRGVSKQLSSNHNSRRKEQVLESTSHANEFAKYSRLYLLRIHIRDINQYVLDWRRSVAAVVVEVGGEGRGLALTNTYLSSGTLAGGVSWSSGPAPATGRGGRPEIAERTAETAEARPGVSPMATGQLAPRARNQETTHWDPQPRVRAFLRIIRKEITYKAVWGGGDTRDLEERVSSMRGSRVSKPVLNHVGRNDLARKEVGQEVEQDLRGLLRKVREKFPWS